VRLCCWMGLPQWQYERPTSPHGSHAKRIFSLKRVALPLTALVLLVAIAELSGSRAFLQCVSLRVMKHGPKFPCKCEA